MPNKQLPIDLHPRRREQRTSRRNSLLLAVAIAALSGCAPHPAADKIPAPARVLALDARHEPLITRFDADATRARLLVLASPT